MPSTHALESLGVFARPAFMSPRRCADIAADLPRLPSTRGTVARDADAHHVDEGVRKVRCLDVPRPIAKSVYEDIWRLRPELEVRFGRSLTGLHGPDFLAYDAGAFYTPHSDAGSHYTTRVVSVVLFLNGPGVLDGAGGYAGGELTFYGLISGPEWAACPVRVTGEPGLLVAFRSDTIHEVRPVTSGTRYTVACWLTA